MTQVVCSRRTLLTKLAAYEARFSRTSKLAEHAAGGTGRSGSQTARILLAEHAARKVRRLRSTLLAEFVARGARCS